MEATVSGAPQQKKNRPEGHYEGVALLRFLPLGAQFVVCVLLVIFLQGAYTYAQELLFSVEKFPHRWYATVWQGGLYSLFAYTMRRSSGERGRRGPFRDYVVLSSVVFMGRFMGVASLHYIDFTTRVLFQSSKLIPTMLVGLLYLKKSYTAGEYTAVFMLVTGLSLFSLGDASVSTSFNVFGVVLAGGDAFSDALKSSIQEHLMSSHSASTLEVALYSNLSGCLCAIPILIFTGELAAVYETFSLRAHIALIAMYLIGYLASLSVLYVLKLSDALISAMVTCFRKFMSIVFSFFIFSKVATINHVVGGVLCFVGIAVQIWIKQRNRQPRLSTKQKH